nr:phloem protein 2-like protein [Tanacetum cinerariifolium]
DEWEWEQKLPRDYNRIIQMSKHPVSSTIKKDLHCLLSSGILLFKENVPKKKNRPTMAQVIEELERAFKSHDEWEWEQKLPRDYNRIIQMSKHPVSSTIKKDLHCLLSSGILLFKENVVT